MTRIKSKPGTKVLDQLENISTETNVSKKVLTINDITLPPGRPSDPNSARQKQLAEKAQFEAEMKAKYGDDWTPQRGRPSNPESANYKKKQELAERKSDPNYVAKQGRPIVANSERQIKLAKIQARKEAMLKAKLEEETVN